MIQWRSLLFHVDPGYLSLSAFSRTGRIKSKTEADVLFDLLRIERKELCDSVEVSHLV